MNDLPELSGPVGSRLRQAREAQGLSVQFVSERLKFSVRQVEALEACQFGQFPHRTQVRGFVRSYARLLQLPETELLQMVDAEVPPDAPQPERPQLKGAVLQTPRSQRWPKFMMAVIVSSLLISGGGWLLYGWLQKSHLTRPPAPENQLLLESDLILPSQASEPAGSVAAGSTAAASTVAASATAGQQLVPDTAPTASRAKASQAVADKGLHLSFVGVSWVEVLDATGRSRYRALGQPQQQVAISGKQPFRVTIGKVTAVKVTFAGQPVDLKPHTRGEVAHLTLPVVR